MSENLNPDWPYGWCIVCGAQEPLDGLGRCIWCRSKKARK